MTRALIGGICIGLAAGLVLLLLGRIAGVTGIVAGAHRRAGWRLGLLVGFGARYGGG